MTSDNSTRAGIAPRPFAGPGHASTWHCMACQRHHGATLGRKKWRGFWVCADSMRMKGAQT